MRMAADSQSFLDMAERCKTIAKATRDLSIGISCLIPEVGEQTELGREMQRCLFELDAELPRLLNLFEAIDTTLVHAAEANMPVVYGPPPTFNHLDVLD